MWYDDLGIISIGVFNGGPEDGGLGDIKVDLWRLFVRHCRSTYCPAIAHYALVVLIGGEFRDFMTDRIERIRRSKRDRCISAEVVVPAALWRGRSPNELRDYLARQVRAALQCCIARLRKDKEPVDEARLLTEVEAAISEFTQTDYEGHAEPEH
jgi:hypothetical protein